MGSGNMIPGLSRSDILRTKVAFPKLDEQRKIADFLSSIDKSIEQVSAQVEFSKIFKKGLLQKMFV
jgi:type I restriction enzyme, S subunit